MDDNNFIASARELPHSIEAEQSVIGAVLADTSALPVVIEKIKPEYFYNEQHKAIYSIILRMFTSGQPVDIITVLNEAEKLHIFDSSAEGRRYLAEIGDALPSTSNIESYCKIVADKYFIRSLGLAARMILDDIQSGEQDSQLLLDAAEQKIYDIRQGRDVQGLIPLKAAITEAYDRLGKISGPDKDKYVGARTGFTLLDSITSGLNKSDLIIIAARPGMGKTSFAMNIATNVARRSEKEVVTFNLEMSKEQLATRILSTEALVDSNSLRNGRISSEDWVKLATSAGYLSTLPLFIDDTASMTVQQMKAKLRRTKNLGLVIIDYLQLMESTSRSDNRVVVISEITRQLKVMAKELNVPVILLSQLSRAVESRTDKRPMLSDLRESGSIEQDADIVLFLYREAYYNKESQRQNISECIVAKNRHGETGTVELIWDGQYTRFSNPEYNAPPEN
ncbi:replicative DNA helicase [uncultured Ruminococcus sp.]|uniref:replicative DNA helicase n=1 Tax=uncultured Ruminococcus sp. TaxID=165186 RepID=UPI0026386537|nr:replicative DNA helicase [uncultured Ruminococcus sp.]